MKIDVKILPAAKTVANDFARMEVERRGKKVLDRARQTCPTDTGNLKASLRLEMQYRATVPIAIVGSNLPYALYVHEGTGIYAGRGYIYPKRAKVLAWKARPGSYNVRNGMVFAARVRGIRGRPWLKQALFDVQFSS